ncbi:MAG TPA: hypothetical protein VFP77_11280 [Gemmatimonadaceae bacterium]|nr:hypothetical protein [Gemmatimonadaceae bacterium]
MKLSASRLSVIASALVMLLMAPRLVSAAEDQGIRLTLRPGSHAFTLHEPVFANLAINNATGHSIDLDLGKNFQGNLALAISGPEQALEAWMPSPANGMFIPGHISLKAGETYREELLLNDAYNFAVPGIYSLSVRLANQSHGQQTIAQTLEPVSIEISPLQPARLAEVCRRLESKALSINAEEALYAARALSYVQSEICIPSLRRVLEMSSAGQDGAVLGLARLGTQKAIDVLVEEWNKLRPDQQAIAYGELERQGKLEILRATLEKSGKQTVHKEL